MVRFLRAPLLTCFMEEAKELYRMRLDEFLNRAMPEFDNYSEEQEFAFGWSREKYEQLGEQSGYVTRFRAAPVNIRERSLEEQVTFIFLGFLARREHEIIPEVEFLKAIGESFYSAWELSGEDMASFGVGPYHMLTETLSARIREEHYIPIMELVDEALSVSLSKDSKNKVVDELMQRNLVHPTDDFYTIDGSTPFLRVGVRTRNHRPARIRAENAQLVNEFVQGYVPAEIEKQGYVEIESIIDGTVEASPEEIALFKQKEVLGLMRRYKGEERDTLEGRKNYVRNDGRNEIVAEAQSIAAQSLPTIILQTHTPLDSAVTQALADIPGKYRERVKTGLVERMGSEGSIKLFVTVYGDQEYVHNDNVPVLSMYAAEIHETLKPGLQRWWENRKRVAERKVEERQRRAEEQKAAYSEEQPIVTVEEAVAKPQDRTVYELVVRAYGRKRYEEVAELARTVPNEQRDGMLAVMVASSYLRLMMPKKLNLENQRRVWEGFKTAVENYQRQVPVGVSDVQGITDDDLRELERFNGRAQRSKIDITHKNNINGRTDQLLGTYLITSK